MADSVPVPVFKSVSLRRIKFNGVLGGAVLTNLFEPWSLTCLDLSNDMSVKKAYIYSSGIAATNGSSQEKDL